MDITRTLTDFCTSTIGKSQHINVDTVHDQLLDYLINTHAYDEEFFATKNKYQPVAVLGDQWDVIDMINDKFYEVDGMNCIRKGFIRDMIQIRGSLLLDNIEIKDVSRYSRLGKIFDRIIQNINIGIDRWARSYFRASRFKKYIKRIPSFDKIGHRDAIQLIPPNLYNHSKVTRYSGAPLSRVEISNISISSKGALQGIFASDGIIEELHVRNCNIKTTGQHAISISGLLKGSFQNIRSGSTTLPVKLYPLRLGGGLHNINILSFSRTCPYQYGTVTGHNIQDKRRTPAIRGSNLIDFDLMYFHKMMMQAQKKSNFNELTSIKEIVSHMLLKGKAVDLGSLLDDLLKG